MPTPILPAPEPSRPPPSPRRRLALGLLFAAGGLSLAGVALAQAVDTFGPPPEDDPSAFRGPSIGEAFAIDLIETLESAIEGALEGGDPKEETVIPEDDLESGGIPTGAPASPLFGAQPFEQRMLLFEEFGVERLAGAPAGTATFPPPSTGPAPAQDPANIYASAPAGSALDAFLSAPGLTHAPTQQSNTTDLNPWEPIIEGFLGRDVETPPAEGRPPGWGWAHQRYNEFFPQVYLKTAQVGARVNGGVRDARQRHGYTAGEFGPGGLYHTVYSAEVAGAPTLNGTTAGLPIQIHPRMPVQSHNSVWTFDGTLPPKLLVGRYGEAILFRHYNGLPIDPSANRGFGLHTITTHEHNGHTPAESDGYANAFYFPGQFFDYRWPMQLAGYDTVNTEATDPRAAMPCDPGETLWVNDSTPGLRTCDANGTIRVRGDWRETASSHWFHDHMLDFTAQNVYKGNAAMFNFYSALDRGNEAHDDGVNLRFPSGTALSWGNRDYDVNLLLADKAWDQSGQLWFNIFNTDGFLGDQLLTNWLFKPFFEVRARSYRFRILNGSVARYFAVALVKEVEGTGGELAGPPGSGISYDRVGFHMIANDGNIMEHTLPFDGRMDLDNDGDFDEHKGALPVQAIAERYDIVVDFASQGIVPGDTLYFVNMLEHDDGKRPDDKIPLSEILSGSYQATLRRGRWEGGDPVVGKFLELRVMDYDGEDLSMNPYDYEPGGQRMIPLPIDRNDPALATARHRSFDFARSGGTDEAPWTIKTDGGAGLIADPRRVSAAPQLATGPTAGGFDGTNAEGYDATGRIEIWSMLGNGGWSHPVHVHFEEGIILSRDGEAPPAWERWARKDIFRIGPEEDSSHDVEVAFHFREFAGTYVEHCHNTQHEDHAMLLRWDLEHPGQVQMMPAPIPTWDGVEYVDSHALPTFRTGDGFGPDDPIPLSVDPPLLGGPPNLAPVFTAQPVHTVTVGETLSFTIQVNDPEGDLVNTAALRLPPGAVYDPGTGVLTWTPTNAEAGEHELRFEATDDGVPPRRSTQTVTVTVEAADVSAMTLNVFTDWGSGYCADLLWTNTTDNNVEDWTIVLGFSGELLSLWNGVSSPLSGGVQIDPEWYNRVVPVGDTLSVGFCVQGSRPTSVELVAPGVIPVDPDAPAPLVTYTEWGRWGAASCGDVTLANAGGLDMTTWTTTFSLPFDTRLSAYWLAEGGEVVSGLVEMHDLGWNGLLAADNANSQTFGVCFEGPSEPMNFFVSGG